MHENNGSRQPNKLINEKSPYLLQHAHNPVDWYPWGDEAFNKAKEEDKPIFLSIGYSTCHWCHVMERESFEDEEVAKLLNDAFVCVKVDREERPDIDSNYMTVCQMITGSGGWPLTIMMTPEKSPFFAGTYIPKGNRFGRTGMMELIPKVSELWENQREELLDSASGIVAALESTQVVSSDEKIDKEISEIAYGQFANSFEETKGGFGTSPKFPTPHNLMFLLRYWKRTGNERALYMVERTLQEMRQGGIYDHVGFGFHRYSTDAKWLVPHFEKMLYDQAMLVYAYSEAYQATGKQEYQKTVDEILSYIIRDMTSPEGGFYSAEDADSEGEEGKFYVWTIDELSEILSDEDVKLATEVFNLHKQGNFIDEAAHTKTGANIPHLQKTCAVLAEELNMPVKELEIRIENIRQKLFVVREKRVHPYKDDKILCDWNGLMIAALAKAAQVFDQEKYHQVAAKAVKFIFSEMVDKDGKLFHRQRDGESAVTAFLDDYAFLTWGLLELYEATFDVSYLEKALELNEYLLNNYWDDENGGFYMTGKGSEKVLMRTKEFYDGAIPSGNSVALMNLLRLGRITADPSLEEKAEQVVQNFSGHVTSGPVSFAYFLSALEYVIGTSFEIVVTGKTGAEDTKKMLNALRRKFVPTKVLLFRPSEVDVAPITKYADFTREHISVDGKATAYLCTNYNCKLPITDTQELMGMLD